MNLSIASLLRKPDGSPPAPDVAAATVAGDLLPASTGQVTSETVEILRASGFNSDVVAIAEDLAS
jgi:hypothetical protein